MYKVHKFIVVSLYVLDCIKVVNVGKQVDSV